MDLGFTTAAYVVAAILFILSLGGLSGQESAKRAVWYGIVGMALAVFATLIRLMLFANGLAVLPFSTSELHEKTERSAPRRDCCPATVRFYPGDTIDWLCPCR